jgi:trehalose 6-phosphate phosphatase
MDKGVALAAYLREVDAGAVLYGGDDLGDIAAFDAVAALREQGLPGLLVASAGTPETPQELAARADLTVPGPEGVVAVLNALADQLG